jgi:molybdenum-dependent DNA-binding transcriptional regulator ModE
MVQYYEKRILHFHLAIPHGCSSVPTCDVTLDTTLFQTKPAWNMLQGSLKYATRKPEICYKETWNMLQGAWNMLQGSLKCATRKPEICYKEAWNMLQGNLKYATRSLKYATRKPEICYKETWNMLQGSLKYATRMPEICYNNTVQSRKGRYCNYSMLFWGKLATS